MATILVVEDDPIIRQTVEYALKRAGFSVHTVADGGAALETAARVQPDLVLLDLMLPGMDGYEIAERLRADDKETAIVMVTALDTERDKVRGLDAGADDYITKPFSMEELLARVRANLRRVRAQGDACRRPHHRDRRPGHRAQELPRLRGGQAGASCGSRSSSFSSRSPDASGQLATRQILADEVWGYEHLPSSRTIDVHIRRLRQASRTPRATSTSTRSTGWATGSSPSLRAT